MAQHQTVFQEGLGTLVGYHAQVQIDPSAMLKFCKARTVLVLYAYRALVKRELDRMGEQGILTSVQLQIERHQLSLYYTKNDKQSIRICGDFRRTANQASKVD